MGQKSMPPSFFIMFFHFSFKKNLGGILFDSLCTIASIHKFIRQQGRVDGGGGSGVHGHRSKKGKNKKINSIVAILINIVFITSVITELLEY